MTITEFINARLDEDEAVARALVLPAHDGHRPHPEMSRWTYVTDGEVEYEQTPEMLAHKYADAMYVTMDGEGITASVDEKRGGAHRPP